MNLAERSRGGGVQIEFGETGAPVRAEFRLHAPADEGGAHRRRLRLQAHQLFGIIGRQRLGDRREQLRDLHHRSLHRPERLGEIARVVAPARPREAAAPIRAAKAPAFTPSRAYRLARAENLLISLSPGKSTSCSLKL